MSIDHIRDSIQAAATYLHENPEEARCSDSPATSIVEEGLRCRVEGPDGVPVVTDMPAAVGGGGSAPTPGWLMRAALANCDATVIAMRAAHQGVALTKLEVTVDSESDDRGLMGLDDSIPAGPLSSRTRVHIASDGADAEQLREIVKWAEAHSPVADAIRRAVPATIEIEIDQ